MNIVSLFKAGCVRLCWVAGNTCDPIYGKWHPIALRWLVHESYIV